ncbi:hypothetical protein HHK36_028279 [Tetracentron sinense]|uniref:Nucleoporin Nup133/Nup155-like N-terminal domain-containing protein n=1 Tax=Tetracentron sinense TaxID=13715 RepID=A0A835D2C4_TETSI|nr:hypothetical protein HHK36_028279 [Tetracentron sinense]
MFSPATKKSNFSSRKVRNLGHAVPDFPSTPLSDNRRSSYGASIPNRPSTGMPAPWASHFSVLARIPPVKKTEKGTDSDPTEPAYVGEFPQVVRDEQSSFLQNLFLVMQGYMLQKTMSFLKSLHLFQKVEILAQSLIMVTVGWYVLSIGTRGSTNKVVQQCNPVGIVICNQKTKVVTLWPNIYSEDGASASFDESDVTFSLGDGKITPNRPQQCSRHGGSLIEPNSFNSLIASTIPGTPHTCIALACSSCGELWQFQCSPSCIYRKKISHDFKSLSTQDQEIQCFNISLSHDPNVSKLWSHEIISTDGDLGIKKDLAGQKRIWPLDMQVDDRGKELTILVATFVKDRVSSSSYTQYSLLTMQYKPGLNISSEIVEPIRERILEIKAPIQFHLPWDAGKVLDASVFPSTEDGEEAKLSELGNRGGNGFGQRSGRPDQSLLKLVQLIVLLGGVEPPEQSLSRKGSSNEGAAEEERRNLTFAANIVPRRASSEAWDAGDRQRAVLTGIARRTAQDVDGSLEKLKNSGAFEKDGETNVFARISKSIVDTLAKHWTTTRGAEIVATTVTPSQLLDKQQKHQRFLQFLALSKCHEELCSRQRHSLQTIMEHGEKLVGMIQLKELQYMINQNRSNVIGSPYSNSPNETVGSLWDLIQLVGEKACRNTVLLMDRDYAEVFYSKVSDLEELLNEATRLGLSAKSDLYSHLEGLADVLLEASIVAITAKVERGEEDKGLLDEYCKRRDVLLDSLYQQVKGFVEARYQVNLGLLFQFLN